MREKVPIHMPPIQLLRPDDLPLPLRRAQIHDKPVVPRPELHLLAQPVLTTNQFTYRFPRLRRELRHQHGAVLGHIGTLAGPGGFVIGVEAEARPDVAREVGGLGGCEGGFNA